MSLSYSDASTDTVDTGSGANLDDLSTGTNLAWVFPTSANVESVICAKSPSDFSGYRILLFDATLAEIQFTINRATSDLNTVSNTSPVSANTWQFVGASWNTAGSNTDEKLYYGNLTTSIAEVGGYGTQTVGSGTVNSDAAGNQGIGNYVPGLTTSNLQGRIAFNAVWNRVLTAGEIKAQQFRPHVTNGCVSFHHLGYNGTGTQADWSGNGNSGTVTGATQADHMPLMVGYGYDTEWVGLTTAGVVTTKIRDIIGMGMIPFKR